MKPVVTDLSKSVKEVETKRSIEIPPGYAEIRLSTQGKVGAPEVFHIRNLSTQDALDLSLSSDEDLPFRLVDVIDGLIFEGDVSVADFHENEVIETLVRLYTIFYKSVIEDVEFPLEEEDYKWLEENYTPEEYKKKKAQLDNKVWVPRTEIEVSQVNTYDIDEKFKKVATIKSRKDDFSATFSLPKYGDVLIVRDWSNETFRKDEARFTDAIKLLKIRDDMISRYQSGDNIDLSRLPNVDPQVEKDWAEFQRKKAFAMIDMIRALHLVNLNGVDVSQASISERVELIRNEPRLDVSAARRLDDHFSKMKFGLKPKVTMRNPLTDQIVERRFSFRLLHIFQAIQSSGTDSYDIFSGDELILDDG